MKDLFENYESLPDQVQTIINAMSEDLEQNTNRYATCRTYNDQLLKYGYQFEYGLDGQPYQLHEI